MNAPAPRLLDQFADHRWRLSNLYYILDKEGRRVRFELNWAQEKLLDDLHYLNLVLKARQLGFTTFIQVFMLDACVWHPNTRAGVIAHTLPDAQAIFRDKIKYPYDSLPDGIKAAVPIVRDNTTSLELGNNSLIRVGASLRSGTFQYLHVSEYGKICARTPEKAREIATGALNTLQAGQVAFVESTAEGREGRFFDMCDAAQTKMRSGALLTPLDWKFHFFPWWKEAGYTLDPEGVTIPDGLARYFAQLEKRGISLTAAQKAWYAKKAETQLEDMKREYPSTPEEAFEASVEGAYYAAQMAQAEAEGRIGVFPAHKDYPVHTVHDIGVGDYHSIWFFQVTPSTVRLVGYYQNSGEGMPHYITTMRTLAAERGWSYGDHYLPHDGKVREWGTGLTRIEQFQNAFPRTYLVPMHSVDDGINAVRAILSTCQFDEGPTADGVKALRGYRKEWNEDLGCWRDKPLHNADSHGADAFRGLAMIWQQVNNQVERAAQQAQTGTELTWDKLMAQQPARDDDRI